MCGISGILKLDAGAQAERNRVLLMRDTLVHRGPDGAGVMVKGPVGLAHRRLSIIDLAGGHQPMCDEQARIWITYNGELYNYKALRSALLQRGCHFATESDTEVVLQAYAVFGDDCVEHLRGMFAFAIWDARSQRLFLARDRLGIKPLYFAIRGKELLFASEIKAILAVSETAPVFNRDVLPEFLASRYVAGGETFFKGITKLLPGHTLSWSVEQGFCKRRYWRPPQRYDKLSRSYADCVDEVRSGLEDSVRRHLLSDVPLGLFLSGGIDSTLLAGLMAPMVKGALKTFSVGFREAEANEFKYARLAAAAVGAEHREVLLSAEQFFAELPKLIWHEDEPIAFTSSVPLYLISRLAREHVKVVLTGEGADELFFGYDYRYRSTLWNLRLGRGYEGLLPSPLRARLAGVLTALPRSLRRYTERSFLTLPCGPRDMFFENFSVFRQDMRRRVLKGSGEHCQGDIHAAYLAYYQQGGDDDLARMSYADLQTYLVELLMKQDQMSMAASLESRVPFLDHQLVEQVASIPSRYRMRGGRSKALLRDAVKDLVPPEIMSRRKMGFPVPLGAWLRGPFWWLVEEFVLSERVAMRGHFEPLALQALAEQHRRGKGNYAEYLWLLINLEIWQRIFIDGEAVDGVYAGCKLMPLAQRPGALARDLEAV